MNLLFYHYEITFFVLVAYLNLKFILFGINIPILAFLFLLFSWDVFPILWLSTCLFKLEVHLL